MAIKDVLGRWGVVRRSKFDHPTLLDHLLYLSPLESIVARLYAWLLWLRGPPFYPPRQRERGRGGRPIRVVCLSDTHDRIVEAVPDGDLLVHAGDLTNSGTAADIQAQIDWLAGLPHRHKVVVCGNHDSWFDERVRRLVDRSGDVVDLRGVTFLQRSGVELVFGDDAGEERRIKVWGAANILRCGGDDAVFAYQYEPKDAEKVWKGIVPMDTEILVTHTPPLGHLDLHHLGCPALLGELWRVRPRLHIFGHVHGGFGREAVFFDPAQRAREALAARLGPGSISSSSWRGVFGRGLVGDALPSRAWLDALSTVLHGAAGVLWRWLMLGPARVSEGSLLVNANVAEGSVQVVDL